MRPKSTGVLVAGLGYRYLGGVVLHLVDNHQEPVQADLARFRIDLRPDFVLLAVTGACRALDRILHRLKHDGFVDCLVAGYCIGDLK
jgi:hypothetical protein